MIRNIFNVLRIAVVLQMLFNCSNADIDIYEPIYPDFSCHKGYGGRFAHLNLQHGKSQCKYFLTTDSKTNFCYERCLLISYGILQQDGNLSTKAAMKAHFRKKYFNYLVGDKTSAELATEIIMGCKKEYKLATKNDCKRWIPYFRCVEEIIECGKKRTKSMENYDKFNRSGTFQIIDQGTNPHNL